MDNPAAPIPSVPLQSAVPPPAETSSRRWFLWSALGLVFLIIGIAIGVFGAKFLNQSQGSYPLTTTPSPTQSLTLDPIANWKEFKDDKSGIRFKHPVNWTIDSQKQTQNVIVALDNENKGVFTVQLALQGIGLECAEIITEEIVYLNEVKANKTITQTTMGDECGNSDSTETIWTSFDRNSVKYLVTYHYIDINDKQERQLFNQILSTFKFTD